MQAATYFLKPFGGVPLEEDQECGPYPDPEFPQERIEFMLRDAAPAVLLTQRQLIDRLPRTDSRVLCLDQEWEKAGGEDATNPRCTTTPDNLAYMITPPVRRASRRGQ